MNLINLTEKIIKLSVPRCLGLIDRDGQSLTFGSADRDYWHYKIKDYNNIRFQEVIIILGLLYKHNFEGNILFNKEWTMNILRGLCGYTGKIQNSDGSYCEVYPYERSFCATSFYTAALTETLILIPELKTKKIYNCLHKTADWLSVNENAEVANQQLASVLALFNAGILLDEEKFTKSAGERLEKVLKNYRKNGYFEEYGGLDIGYNSISLGLIQSIKKRKYYEITDCNKIINKIDNATNQYGMYNYENFSRKTNFLYLSGLINNFSIMKKVSTGLAENMIPNPLWMDDRYLISILKDYILTFIEVKDNDVYDSV